MSTNNVRDVAAQWKVIGGSVMCCSCQGNDDVTTTLSAGELSELTSRHETDAGSSFIHPRDAHISLSNHKPLCLPGNIIHVVRNHPPGAEYELS